MKTIVAGGRDLEDYNLVKQTLDKYYREISEIVCGEAKGADSLGKVWGEANGFHITSFPANWDKYGKSAGYIRNSEMADYADYLVAFWDGKSKGTKHMIDLALSKRVPMEIVFYYNGD